MAPHPSFRTPVGPANQLDVLFTRWRGVIYVVLLLVALGLINLVPGR